MLAAEFPEELVVELLTRLPVKPLLKFRCVSKTWRSLIDSSFFLKSQLSKNRNSKIYVFEKPRYGSINSIALAEVNLTFAAEVDSMNTSDGLVFQSHKIPVSSPPDTEVVGSCDGLICLWSSFPKEIFLVNPSTREYRLLPPISKRFLCFVALGIGYDCSAEEYKVVMIPETRKELYIYGSKSNSWRYVDVSTECTSSIDRTYGCNGVYIYGALHWTMCRSKRRFWIAAFDLVTEKFTVVGYNRDFFGNPDYFRLKVVGGQLCLVCRHDIEKDEEDYTVIWVMEEYGVGESWSILASFKGHVELTAFSTCGKRLLVSRLSWPHHSNQQIASLHWYDLDKKVMGMEFTTSRKSTSLYVCQQSLVRLEGKLG